MNLLEAKELLEENGYEVIVEDYDTITMNTLAKNEYGLPANGWVDVGQSYKKGQHWKRIKFQMNTSNKYQRNNLFSMDFDGNILNGQSYCKLSKKEIAGLVIFVKNNKEALELLADGLLLFENIKPYLIKGTKPATQTQKERLLKAIEKFREV